MKGRYRSILAISTIVAIVVIAKWGVDQFPSVDNERTLPALPQYHQLEDVWFGPSAQLFLLARRAGSVTLQAWRYRSTLENAGTQKVDLLKSGNNSASGALRYSFGFLGPSPFPGPPVAPYSISPDGARIAIVSEGVLRVGTFQEWTTSKIIQIPIHGEDSVQALTFTAPGVVTLIRQEPSPPGTLPRQWVQHWDYRTRQEGIAGTTLRSPAMIWSRGSRLLLSFFETGDFGVIPVQGANENRGSGFAQSGFRDGTAITISENENSPRVVIGNARGEVHLYSGRSSTTGLTFRHELGIPLDSERPINSIAFHGEELLIGGEFQDIYLIDKDLNDHKIAHTASGVRLIATQGSTLVYATPRKIVAARIIRDYKLNDIATWAAVFYSILLAYLSIWDRVFPPSGSSKTSPGYRQGGLGQGKKPRSPLS